LHSDFEVSNFEQPPAAGKSIRGTGFWSEIGRPGHLAESASFNRGFGSMKFTLKTAAVAIVGMIFVVRRTLVLRSAENLVAHPDDSLTLNHWKTGYFATYALCEALALLGMVLRFLGFPLHQSLSFYLGGFVLLFFFAPREPAPTPTT